MKIYDSHSKSIRQCIIVNIILILSFLLMEAGAQDSVVTTNLLVPQNGSTVSDTRPCDNPFVSHSADSSIPLPIKFIWNIAENSPQPVIYNLSVSEDSLFKYGNLIFNGITDTQQNVWNLKNNTIYYWKIIRKDTLNNMWDSPIFKFTTPDVWPRMIYIDGSTNVRDIGGLTVMNGRVIRQGIFYRSAEFEETFPITQKGLEQLRSLGIVCEIDLRNNSEDPHIIMPWLLHYVRPVIDGGAGMDCYYSGLVNTPGAVREVFKEMADKNNYPMIIHCRLGADRTGTIAALLEALLGCSELQMARDYIWTSLSAVGTRDTATGDWRNVVSYLKSFDTENGSIQLGTWNYLQSIGVSVDELISIRKIFIGDSSQPYSMYSVRRPINSRHSSKNAITKIYLVNSLNGLSFKGKSIRMMEMFDLSGRKIREYSVDGHDNPGMIKQQLLTNGVHILRCTEETEK